MRSTVLQRPVVCARCLADARRTQLRSVRTTTRLCKDHAGTSTAPKRDAASLKDKEHGAMSRLLGQMTEESLESGGKSAQRSIQDTGFDDELKARLLERIAETDFKSDNAAALSISNAASSVDKAGRDLAAAPAWHGSEKLADAASRMLNDSVKPLKVPFKMPRPATPPKRIDTGRPGDTRPSTGTRLANARDKTSAYAFMNDPNATEAEKEQFRKQMKDRFVPGARSVPATLSGLASLADERITNAIARGQFRNLPDRGKPLDRDHNMDSPFIDTTEYFMNKIIKKQEIVPPWIEKQQELSVAISRFRGRLRNDWKRHAARTIASAGGRLEDQLLKANEYAVAEAVVNPQPGSRANIALSTEHSNDSHSATAPAEAMTPDPMSATSGEEGTPSFSASAVAVAADRPITVFRDADWERTENSYLSTAIAELNLLTRSYNLMAPNLAKKPYFTLERELRACFAEVAPHLASEIRQRALAPKAQSLSQRSGPASIIASIGQDNVRVYDETKPQYGFREFWRDLRANLSTRD